MARAQARWLLIAFLAFFPAPASALDPDAALARHLGPLADRVALGDDGVWRVAAVDDGVSFGNPNDPGAVRYYWVDLVDLGLGDYELAGEFFARSDDQTFPVRIGLLFDFQARDQYFGFVLGADGAAHLLVRSPDGFSNEPLTAPRPRLDGKDRLVLQVEGERAVVTLNGETMLSLEGEGGFEPKAGLIIAGAGEAWLRNLTLTPLGGLDAPPASTSPEGDGKTPSSPKGS